MSFKEVKELRQSGNLEDALEMAIADLEAEPENIWCKRAAAWVYYDLLKQVNDIESFDEFIEYLVDIVDLELPEAEKMVFDNCAWQVGSMVFNICKSEDIDYSKINKLFDLIKNLNFTISSEAYSFIYKAFHKASPKWSRYIEFADWWNFENFTQVDYNNEKFKERELMSIVEKAYIAYSKKLLEGDVIDSQNNQRKINTDKIGLFILKLDDLIKKHPEYPYPPFYYAKLLIVLGDKDKALKAFLPFAKQKRNDFWVWELLAEIFSDNSELNFACYCKALTLKTPEDFLINIRQTFAKLLIERKMFNEAKTEIKVISQTRTNNKWSIPQQLISWQSQTWYKEANVKNDNKDLYASYVKNAEAVLFNDIPEEIIAVEFVNENKLVLSFVKNKEKFGFFKYAGIIHKPKIGDLLKVRFNGNGKEGFYKVLTATKIDSNQVSEAIKNVTGKVRINSAHNFGFIEDTFIEPALINRHNITDGKMLNIKAILSFNKKRNDWGWKAVELIF